MKWVNDEVGQWCRVGYKSDKITPKTEMKTLKLMYMGGGGGRGTLVFLGIPGENGEILILKNYF